MNWRMLGLIAIISSGAVMFASAARAEPLDFSFAGDGGPTVNFTMDSQPQSSVVDNGIFDVSVVDGTQFRPDLGQQKINFVQFFNEASG
jgi:hypothetical protein